MLDTSPSSLTLAVLVALAVGLVAMFVAALARRDVRRAVESAEQAERTARDAGKRAEQAEQRAAAATARAVAAADRMERSATRQAERDARRDEQRRLEAHDRRGPGFELVGVHRSAGDRSVAVDLRVVGGPDTIDVEVEPVDTPWCRGVSTGALAPGRVPDPAVQLRGMRPRSVFRFLADLDERPPGATLTLAVTAEAVPEDGAGTWSRTLRIPVNGAAPQ